MCILVINVCRVLCFNPSPLKPEQINIRDHTAESSEVGVNADSTFRPVLLGSFCSVNEVFRVQFQEFCWCLSYKLYHHKKIFSCESYLMIDRTFFNSVANLEACGKKQTFIGMLYFNSPSYVWQNVMSDSQFCFEMSKGAVSALSFP